MMLEQQISQKNAVQGRVALGMIHSAVSMLSDFQFSFLFFFINNDDDSGSCNVSFFTVPWIVSSQ